MNPKQFRQLQQTWDQKLRESGFKDIEDRETGLLTSWTGSYPINPFHSGRTYKIEQRQDSQGEYYRLAQQAVHDPRRFRSPLERKVWALHADGKPYSVIARTLGITKRKVQSEVEAVRKRVMGI